MHDPHREPDVEGAPNAWRAADLEAARDRWVITFVAAELNELEAAVARCVDDGRELLDIDRAAFPLSRLGRRLAEVREQALWGLGVTLIRGLPVERWSRRETATALWGIGAHLGSPVSQNAQGHVLGHVKDLGLNYHDRNTRGYQTRARLPYHTDYSDLVALLCLRTAREGGLSSIASSTRIYLEMRRRRPDLAQTLTRPVYRSRWGEVSAGQNRWLEVPVFNLYSTGVSTTYVRSAVEKAQAMPEVPRLTDRQIEAMDLFDALAADPTLHVDMAFEPGDLQIVNNHCIVHSRTAYVDRDDAEDKRHLLRLWLACEDGPPFPLAMTEQFQGLTHNGRPNGIHIAGVPFVAPLDASPSDLELEG